MIEMVIDSIRASMVKYERVVILKEKAADRYLPIWIGPAEANAIAIKFQNIDVPRPLTHDLLCSVIDALGSTIDAVLVNDLRDDTFYAKLILNTDGQQIEVDSRPSDAIALAIRTDTPIYVDESVLDRAGILLDSETGKPVTPESSSTSEGEGGKIDPEKMSAFLDFINTLDLDDFKKNKS